MLSNINKNIPLVSACLVSFGYLNYYVYYSQFNIDIGSYLTPSELVFSFLPLLIPFLSFAIFWILLSIGISLAYGNYERTEGSENSERILYALLTSVPNAVRVILQWMIEKKKPKDWFYSPLLILALIISICTKIFLFYYVYLIFKLIIKDPVLDLQPTIALGVVWIALIFARSNAYKIEDNKIRIRELSFVFGVALALFLLSEWNKAQAKKVLMGEQTIAVTINLEDSNISTDSFLVSVGKTSQFIFLRDLKTDQNQIIKMEEVKSLNQSITKANSH